MLIFGLVQNSEESPSILWPVAPGGFCYLANRRKSSGGHGIRTRNRLLGI
jgi:hypothetical protein